MILSCYSNKRFFEIIVQIFCRIIFIVIILLLAYPAKYSIAKTSAILLANDQGTILYSKNEDQQLVPASTLKILTSLAAFDNLGPLHKFEVWFSFDEKTKNLYVKGFGNPLFISEEIKALCVQILKTTEPQIIHDIILDHSYFSPGIRIPGTSNSANPYDATTGSLCANFNTIFFKWDRVSNQYISAEPQTPLLKVFNNQIKASGQQQGRILLSKTQRPLYAGLLIQHFIKEMGVSVTGNVVPGKFNAFDSPREIFESKFSLPQTIGKLLKYSNNYIANQLMLVMGANEFGPPATLNKGMRVLRNFAKKKLELKGITLFEASGISRQNRLSAAQMLKILLAFMPYHELMQKNGDEYYKTGTLSDVRTRAGYFAGKDQRLYPFVIMLNDTRTGYQSIKNELHQRVLDISISN